MGYSKNISIFVTKSLDKCKKTVYNLSQMVHFGVAMNKEHYVFITKLFPFRDLKEKQLDAIFNDASVDIKTFVKDSVIYAPDSYEKRVGFVIDGECSVERKRSDGDKMTLNTLTKFSSFGIMAVLSGKDEYPTIIRAARTSTVMFIDGDDMIAIIKKYPTVAMNVMRFLADRVSFLNEKINTLSEKSTLSRLANHLLRCYKTGGERITVSKSKLATQIDVGRASLYRDLDTLTERGLISVEQKSILIIDPIGLERIIK